MASCSPVEAPDGTAALPTVPSARITSTSTVGLPRESRISRARMSEMLVISGGVQCQPSKKAPDSGASGQHKIGRGGVNEQAVHVRACTDVQPRPASSLQTTRPRQIVATALPFMRQLWKGELVDLLE